MAEEARAPTTDHRLPATDHETTNVKHAAFVILSEVEGSISESGKQKSVGQQPSTYRPPTTDH